MKQLHFFAEYDEKVPEIKRCQAYWKIFIDGASRNNPGPAGVGFYVIKDGKEVAKKGYFVGIKTNNQAEYLACIIGTLFLQQYVVDGDCVQIISDSQLLVRQLEGAYRVKAPELKPLFAAALRIKQALNADVFHVARTDNQQADAMANEGIDAHVPVPASVQHELGRYGISL